MHSFYLMAIDTITLFYLPQIVGLINQLLWQVCLIKKHKEVKSKSKQRIVDKILEKKTGIYQSRSQKDVL